MDSDGPTRPAKQPTRAQPLHAKEQAELSGTRPSSSLGRAPDAHLTASQVTCPEASRPGILTVKGPPWFNDRFGKLISPHRKHNTLRSPTVTCTVQVQYNA